MPNIQVITADTHKERRWRRYSSYHFAAGDALIPLVVQELPKAVLSLPLGFVSHGNEVTPVAVQGLHPGKNLLVGPEGQWLGGYIPAAYRGYPFLLARTGDGREVLCIDEESGLTASDEGELFFGDDGQPAPALAGVLDFLTQVAANRQATIRICSLLQQLQLIQPWPITVKDHSGEKNITGLWRVDETALNGLSDADFAALRRGGALPVIYCQLLSMQHLPRLGQLAAAHAKHHAPLDLSSLDIEALFGGGDDTIKFTF